MESINNYQQYIDLAVQYGTTYGLKILVALIIFWVGKRVARGITNLVDKALKRNDVDQELISFLHSLIYYGLLALVIVVALSQVGIQTASLVAVLGAAGLAVGLALQGSLSNFAAGVLIILLRPFKVGDWIDAAGVSGKVQAIKVFTTELRTGDNKCVIIPNAQVLNDNIINHSSTGTRRVDMLFGIGYDDDIDTARNIILDILNADERIHQDPEPVVRLQALADSSVNLTARPWTNTEHYWDVMFETTEQVKKAFDDAGITIPYPQREVHLIKE